ncbi:MAG: hypothetical protein NVSMB65_07370 [Chloroflexota bacterium]
MAPFQGMEVPWPDLIFARAPVAGYCLGQDMGRREEERVARQDAPALDGKGRLDTLDAGTLPAPWPPIAGVWADPHAVACDLFSRTLAPQGPGGREPLGQRVVGAFRAVSGAAGGSLWVEDPISGALLLDATTTPGLPLDVFDPSWDGHPAVQAERAPGMVAARPAPPALHVLLQGGGFAGAIVIDLCCGDRRVGVVALYDARPLALTREQWHALSAVTTHAALVLDHRRLTEVAESRTVGATAGTESPWSLARAVVEHLPHAVVVLDAARGDVILCNDAARSLMHDEFDGALRWPLVHPTGLSYAAPRLPLVRAIKHGETVAGEEAILTRHDGTPVPVLVSAAPLHDTAGEVCAGLAVFLDISHVTELDRLKNDFLAMLRHELNTPVTTVKGFIQLAQRRLGHLSEEDMRPLLAQAARSAERLHSLLDALLDVSRLQTGLVELRHDEVDMNRVVAHVAESLQATTDLHRLEVRTAVQPLPVLGDGARLREVLVSLVSNAIKYTPAGGVIALHAYRADEMAIVSVTDHGVGIAEGEKPHIFEPFYRGHNAVIDRHGGLGMGLHISKQIVEWHGGTLWLDSKEGQGSTFFCALPLSRAAPAGSPQEGEVGAGHHRTATHG